MKNAKIIIITALITLIAGIGIGRWLFHQEKSTDLTEQKSMVKETTWICAMHPQIRQNEPGKCPICVMDLTPLEETSSNEDQQVVQMSENAAKLANIQTTIIGSGNSEGRKITMQGKIEIDERRIKKIPAHFHGRIEKLYVNFTGEQVTKGQLLAEVYSPELIAAQEELLQSMKYKESNPAMYKASKNKLKYWKIANSEIERIELSGEALTNIKIHSHHSGVVLKRNVTQGDHVKMGDILLEIADLDKLWALFDVYEKDLKWIKKGAKIEFTLGSLNGKTYRSTVSFIDPMIDAKTRVAKVRAEVNNTSGQLKPEMFAYGTLNAPVIIGQKTVLVPQSAVLWTGKQSLVYVKKTGFDQPTFEYRQIIIGSKVGDNYVVERGLKINEEVVTHGAFTIDAAAQLSGKTSMMNPGEGADLMDIPATNLNKPEHTSNKEIKSQANETSFWVGGNCGMCKERIEGALKDVKGVLSADWNAVDKMLSVSYNNSQVNLNDIQEKISAVGHDTEKMKTKDDVYDNLHGCCKYDREKK